ncbi:cellulose biosynthesis protein BcsR [Brenneria populi]|uniref:cellulose biosynthesis protein BcsR n=1 Tax=Brenneria populi TaxID=1505588 RepID=UPI00399A8D67
MNDKISPSKTVVYAEMHDDFRVLSQAFSLPEINYIDISRQTRLAQMMERWPLLAELKESTGSR